MKYLLLALCLLFFIPIAQAVIINDPVTLSGNESLSYLLQTDGKIELTSPYSTLPIDFDSTLAANDAIRYVDIDLQITEQATWDYKITLYGGLESLSGLFNATRIPVVNLNTYTISVNEETTHKTVAGSIFSPGQGIMRFEYWRDKATKKGYIGVEYCTQSTTILQDYYTSCGIPVIFYELNESVSSTPMTHVTFTKNSSMDSSTEALLKVDVDLVKSENINGNEPETNGKFRCEFTDVGTWPGCFVNWGMDNIPYLKTFIAPDTGIFFIFWGIALFFFDNILIFVFLIPGIDFAYRLSTEPSVFTAISKTSADMIYLVGQVMLFFYHLIRTIIPI